MEERDSGMYERNELFVRSEALFGPEAMERLYRAHVAVFGVGGVGGHAVEALARGGIGRLDLFDHDVVTVSNINRQLAATLDTVGQYKTDVMRERIARIHPQAQVRVYHCFYLPENADTYDLRPYDFIVDAIDTVAAKVELIVRAQAAGTQIISCMGAGNKLDPTELTVADIYETSVCPLARTMRRELKARGVRHCPVVYSREPARKPRFDAGSAEAAGRLDAMESMEANGRSEAAAHAETPCGLPGQSAKTLPSGRPRAVPGSNSFVPAAAGLILAGYVIRTLAGV